jgi:hypothetical protein
MYAFRTPHAPEAVVCDVSSWRSVLTSWQAANHSPSTVVAALFRAWRVPTQAATVACAEDVVTWRSEHPSVAP